MAERRERGGELWAISIASGGMEAERRFASREAEGATRRTGRVDPDEVVLHEAEALLGNGRAEDVLDQGLAAALVLGAGSCGGVQ